MARRIKEWFDAEQVKPPENKWFAMCHLDLGEEIIPGWWTGVSWDGRKYDGQKVLRWRYSHE